MKEVIAQGFTRRISRNQRPRYHGLCYQEDRNIIIFERKNRDQLELIDSIVHEEIHAVFPEFDEREAMALTSALVGELTSEQKKQYFELYGRGYVGEVEEESFVPHPIGELALETGL